MILTKAGQTFADDKADVEIQEEYGAPAAPVIDSYGGPQAAPISRLFIIIIITILINYHYNPYQLSLSIIEFKSLFTVKAFRCRESSSANKKI